MMANLVTLATLGRQDTGVKQTKHRNTTQKAKRAKRTSHKPGENPGASEGQEYENHEVMIEQILLLTFY